MSAHLSCGTRRLASPLALLALALLPAAAAAQSLAGRVSRAPDGLVHFSYPARPGVCGNGRNNISINSRGRGGSARVSDSDDWEGNDCEPGPVRIALMVQDHQVTRLHAYVGGRWRSGTDATDLGDVSGGDAADWLIGLAERGNGQAGRDAIFAATLADGARDVWPRLIHIARDEGRPGETRKAAVFWLGQAAGDAATAHLDTLAADEAVDRDIREQAVFALSQRPRDEGVPALIRIARTNRDPEVRRKALFWLGQSGDPRALALFEELLTRQ